MGSLESYFRVKPPCPAFGGVAPPNMKIEQVAGGTSNSIFELKNQILLKMDRKYVRTGPKPGQNEGFGTYWGWSILVPACPGWVGGKTINRISDLLLLVASRRMKMNPNGANALVGFSLNRTP
jgi:hypothetical protein